MVENELNEVTRRLRRIIFLAGNGFYQTVSDSNRITNWFFLTILKEAYKALNTIYQMKETSVVENVYTRNQHEGRTS